MLNWLQVTIWIALFILIFNRKNFFNDRKNIFVAVYLFSVYFYWRINYTILPYVNDEDVSPIWMWSFLLVEIISIADIFQLHFFGIKSLSKKTENYKISNHDKDCNFIYPSVDVLIPTYNESVELLRKTLIRATNINYPNYKVSLLDDGCRKEMELLAHEMGVQYFSRESNEGAKAGNMNAALPFLDGEIIAILDADFLAYDQFLLSGTRPFTEKRIGIVQFPQTFYNPDPTQKGSGLINDLQDEQWNWYRKFLPMRNRSGLSTSCGSCSLVRREYLDEIGGLFPDRTITEDFDLSLHFLQRGWQTLYINETVAIGLQANEYSCFFKQRIRWAIGNAHAWFYQFKSNKLPFLSFLALFEWRIFSMPARFITFITPGLVLCLSVYPLKASSLFEYLTFFIPMILALSLHELSDSKSSALVFFMVQARTLGVSLILGLGIIIRLIRYNFNKFDVTNKSSSNIRSKSRFQLIILSSLVFSLFSAYVGVEVVLDDVNQPESFWIAFFWQILNLFLIVLSFFIFLDRDYPRNSERMIPEISTKVAIVDASGNYFMGHIVDLSETGVKVKVDQNINFEGTQIVELFGSKVSSRLIYATKSKSFGFDYAFHFYSSPEFFDILIRNLYSGRFSPGNLKTLSV